MTENKRFTYEYDEYNGNLFDNKYGTFFHIEDSEENIRLLCNRLNELHEENRLLQMRYDAQRELYGKLDCEYNNLKEENKDLKSTIEHMQQCGAYW